MPRVNLQEAILTDLWIHIGGIFAICIGLFADRFLGTGLGSTANLMFILGGFAAMGLNITNGTIKATAAAAAEAVKTTAATIAASTVSDAKSQAATTIADAKTVAAQTVADAAITAASKVPPVVP